MVAGGAGEALWAETAKPTLVPAHWAVLAISLLAIVLLGIFLLLIIIHGARIVRRKSGRRLPPTHIDEDDWSRKPLLSDAQDDLTQDAE